MVTLPVIAFLAIAAILPPLMPENGTN